MRRALLALLLLVGLTPGTLFQKTRGPWIRDRSVQFTPVTLPPRAVLAQHLGVFELEAAWSLTSPYSGFGGYSALLTQPGGQLLTISDSAQWLSFSPPGAAFVPARGGEIFKGPQISKRDHDTESATQDPATGTIWLGLEDRNAITRHDARFGGRATIRPPAMRDWPSNSGPEAMVRLRDGRFIVLEEGFTSWSEARLHHALLFPRDPLLGDKPVAFTFAGAPQFSPTDMAELPDGRLLILMRRLVWAFPMRFACRIVIADPAAIRLGAAWPAREVAKLSSSLPVDNFEGLAIAPRGDGRVTVWLISDQNGAATQRTLLWKLALDPAKLK